MNHLLAPSPYAESRTRFRVRPASLYIHIPFCASRCGYCTFTSMVYSAELADEYLHALEKELNTWNYFDSTFFPETIFIGGGTPSVLTMAQIERLLSFLPKTKNEFSCEINPDSCSREKMQLLRNGGVNRLSFGVQTFDSEGLKLLQRRHDRKQAIDAVGLAVEMGFPSVSVDLINGWPGQTEQCLKKDIEIAINLGIHHLSSYNLVLEPSASEYTRYCELLGGEIADEETGKRFWYTSEDLLESKGFKHYETSNFSLPGFECRHNVLTWRGEEYLGIGLGACSHIAGVRWTNTDMMETYCTLSYFPDRIVAYSEKLGPEEKARECAVFWLRLFDGIDLDEFAGKTGYDFLQLYNDVLPQLIADGIVVLADKKARVEKKFHPVLDSVLEFFI